MSQPPVSLHVRQAGPGRAVIEVEGDLTGAAETALAEAYTAADAQTIVLNFSQLAYMNSTGIGLLVTLLVRAKRQARALVACGLSEHYRHIFNLTRLDEAIRVFDSEAEALRAG
jgi:anti-sigma B factor antagonist